MQAGLGELKFNPIELCKRISEVNEKKVSLVSQQREDGGLISRRLTCSFLPLLKEFNYLGFHFVLFRRRKLLPLFPVKTKHLVKDAGTFDRNRNTWQIRHVFSPIN